MCPTIQQLKIGVSQIRCEVHASMNGVISESMQEKGMNYRLNYGVDIPKLRIIARKYEANKALAEMLWTEEVRELKILATMLYPPIDFKKETAEKWMREIPTQEIREQICRNLFQTLPFADTLVQEWAENKNVEIRITGYWLFARLCIIRSSTIEKVNPKTIIENAVNDLNATSMLLRQAALNVLRYFGRLSKKNGTEILHKIADYEKSDNLQKREIFDILRFEFEPPTP